MEELRSWLTLVRAPGIDAGALAVLLKKIPSVQEIVHAKSGALAEAGLDPTQVAALTRVDQTAVDIDLQWLDGPGNAFISWNDARYPRLLREIPNAPLGLFVHGDATNLCMPQLAMVGSRNPTASGRETAESFAAHLARCGLAITSGLAIGIDAAGHAGALRAGGTTIAVCATGLDVVYPRTHARLAAEIAERGALVSEFPTRTPPQKFLFPRRNRIISGLALGTLVVEAALHSGSLITAKFAAEQGREVFAIPGSIHNPLARGCHLLLRQGAKLVESAEDILSELGPLAAVQNGKNVAAQSAQTAQVDDRSLDKEYKMLLDALGFDPASVDQLVARSGLKPEAVASMLLILELDGRVEALPGARFVRAAG